MGRFRGPGPVEMYHPDAYFWVHAVTKIAVLVLIIIAAVLLFRYLTQRYPAGAIRAPGSLPPGGGASSSAMQILEERFARGDIDEEEFRSRKDALRS